MSENIAFPRRQRGLAVKIVLIFELRNREGLVNIMKTGWEQHLTDFQDAVG